MRQKILFIIVFFVVIMLISACGGESADSTNQAPTQEGQNQEATGDVGTAKEQGEAIAKEILDTFDSAVKEVAELVKDKPEAAELKPKLEALYKTYEEKMKEINVRYLALKPKDIESFGAANGYLGEYRGKHVFKKDRILGDIAYYYASEKGDEETSQLISKKLIDLLEIAVKR